MNFSDRDLETCYERLAFSCCITRLLSSDRLFFKQLNIFRRLMSSTVHVLSNGAFGGQPSNDSPHPVASSAEASSFQSPVVIPPVPPVGETERRYAEGFVRSLQNAEGRSIVRLGNPVQTVYCVYGRNDNDGSGFIVSVGDGVAVRNQGDSSSVYPTHIVSDPGATKVVKDAVAARYYAHRSALTFDADLVRSGDSSEVGAAGFKAIFTGPIDSSTSILLVIPAIYGGNPKHGPMSGLGEVFISHGGSPFTFTDTVFDNTRSLTARPVANWDRVRPEGTPRLPPELSALFQYVVRGSDGKVFGRLVAHTGRGAEVSRITWYPRHEAAPLTTIWSPDVAV